METAPVSIWLCILQFYLTHLGFLSGFGMFWKGRTHIRNILQIRSCFVRTVWKHFLATFRLLVGLLELSFIFFSFWTEPAVPNGVCDASGRTRYHQQPYWTLRASGRVHHQDFRNFHPPVPGSTASLQVLRPWTYFLFNHCTAIHIANFSCIRQYRCNISGDYLWTWCPGWFSDIT